VVTNWSWTNGIWFWPTLNICSFGQNRMYGVYDRMFDKFPAWNTVYLPYIYLWLWPTLNMRKNQDSASNTCLPSHSISSMCVWAWAIADTPLWAGLHSREAVCMLAMNSDHVNDSLDCVLAQLSALLSACVWAGEVANTPHEFVCTHKRNCAHTLIYSRILFTQGHRASACLCCFLNFHRACDTRSNQIVRTIPTESPVLSIEVCGNVGLYWCIIVTALVAHCVVTHIAKYVTHFDFALCGHSLHRTRHSFWFRTVWSLTSPHTSFILIAHCVVTHFTTHVTHSDSALCGHSHYHTRHSFWFRTVWSLTSPQTSRCHCHCYLLRYCYLPLLPTACYLPLLPTATVTYYGRIREVHYKTRNMGHGPQGILHTFSWLLHFLFL
jgi:hypothetical protein